MNLYCPQHVLCLEVSLYSKSPHPMISTLLKKPQALYSSAIAALGNRVETLDLARDYYLTRHPLLMSVVQEVVNYFASRVTLVHVWKFGEHCNLLQIQHVQGVRLKNLASNQWGGMYTVEKWEFPFIRTSCIIRTVVRIVGMDRMSHNIICNTKCSRCSRKYLSLQTCLESLSDSILTAYKRKIHRNFPERQ